MRAALWALRVPSSRSRHPKRVPPRTEIGGFFPTPPPRVIAHRGLAIDAPENTLLAFAKAIAAGVQHLETDVHVSADGKAIVSHDPRLTRVAGRDVAVEQLTVAELRRVDLGHGQGFTTLAEALDAFPDARFNIDVKVAGVVQATIDAIRDAKAINRTLVTSFSDARRRATVAGLPGVATSAASATVVRLLAASTLRLRPAAARLLGELDAVQVPERWGALKIVTPRFLRMVQDAGVEVHVWTINAQADMERLLDLGVDGLVTDRADLAMELLSARR